MASSCFRFIMILVLGGNLASPVAIAGDQEEEELVQSTLMGTRRALGSFPAESVELSGNGTIRGAQAKVTLLFAKDGRFSREVDGALSESIRFDGARGFEIGESGIACDLVRSGLHVALLENAVISGSFADFPERFVWKLDPASTEENAIVLDVTFPESHTHGRLVIDSGTHLPRSLTIPSFAGEYRMQLADYFDLAGRKFPRRVEIVTTTQSRMDWKLTAGNAIEDPPIERFVPQRRPRGFHFDPQASATLSVKKLPTGHLLIRGTIDGEDRGPVAFDTGAAVSVVHERVATAAGMELIGSSTLVGAGGEVMPTEIRRGKELTLGPLVIERAAWTVAAEGSPIGKVFDSLDQLAGEQVAAIVGYEILIRSVVELDLAGPGIAIHDPARFDSRGFAWEPMVLHRRHPFVKAKFNGSNEGLFCIDSGAGSISVIFHGPVVKALNLLEGRKTQPVFAQGAGGRIELRLGTIDDFEVAGQRTENPQCLFSQDDDGALADADSEGTMGHAFFQSVVMILDYGNGRIAFRPRDSK